MIRDDLEERKETSYQLEEEITVADFLEEREIEKQEVLVSRDDKIISKTTKLNDGDVINVFDVIAGG